MAFGDSKTSQGAGGWQTYLMTSLEPVTYRKWDTYNGGVAGQGVETAQDAIDAELAAAPDAEDGWDIRVLLNWGIAGSILPVEADWKADYLYILDAIHVKWPYAQVYLHRPWSAAAINEPQKTNQDTIDGWISDVVAARPVFAHLGPDERVWLEYGDGGATMTYDGVHYSLAGHYECAAQWKTVLGY